MLKRFIALAGASTALALAVSFYARVPTGHTGVEVGLSHKVTSSVTGADGVTNGGITTAVSAYSGGSLSQVENTQNSPNDDYVAYRHVFSFIYSEAQGKDIQGVNSAVEYFKAVVPLGDDEAIALAKIALESETRNLAIEKQAAEVIRRFRENFEAEVKSGKRPSPEPPEFKTLQEQRVRTTLQSRDELRKAFGESTFSRFDTFLIDSMHLKTEKAIPSPEKN